MTPRRLRRSRRSRSRRQQARRPRRFRPRPDIGSGLLRGGRFRRLVQLAPVPSADRARATRSRSPGAHGRRDQGRDSPLSGIRRRSLPPILRARDARLRTANGRGMLPGRLAQCRRGDSVRYVASLLAAQLVEGRILPSRLVAGHHPRRRARRSAPTSEPPRETSDRELVTDAIDRAMPATRVRTKAGVRSPATCSALKRAASAATWETRARMRTIGDETPSARPPRKEGNRTGVNGQQLAVRGKRP